MKRFRGLKALILISLAVSIGAFAAANLVPGLSICESGAPVQVADPAPPAPNRPVMSEAPAAAPATASPAGLTWPGLVAVLGAVVAIFGLTTLVTRWVLARRNRPAVEGQMVGRVYAMLGVLVVAGVFAYGFGVLGMFGTLFSLFGGMLLGWSLQAPVSGFAAYVLVSLKRPFRPGDRVQFPNLGGLVGDVKDIGVMYTVLNQVGGSIGSEEAVGRNILVPNAMLFGQVIINYTVVQTAAYMLDEAVVRITYDSDWRVAEQILLAAAQETTADIIQATGENPYIRADLYDYGVYLRLRYKCRVQDRAMTSYLINKRIFAEFQQNPKVDMAIPFVYSSRAGMDRKEDYRADMDRKEERASEDREGQAVRNLEVDQVDVGTYPMDAQEVQRLAARIESKGLLQPLVVIENPESGKFEILAGHLRFEACKRLGWKTIPAVVRSAGARDTLARPPAPPSPPPSHPEK